MKIKKGKVVLIFILAIFTLISASATTLALTPSSNKNYNSTLEEVFSYLKGEYKTKNEYYTEIVAYINGEPIYKAEVIVAHERAKIFYMESILYGESDQTIIELRESDLNKSDEDMIKDIAQARVIIAEAEKYGINITDDDVLKAQNKIIEDRKLKIKQGNESASEIEKQYQKLYDILGITELQYYQSYDYLFQKYTLIGSQLANKFMTDYYKKIHETNEPVDINAWNKYIDNLMEKSDFKIIK